MLRLSALNVDKLYCVSTTRIMFLIDSWWTSVTVFSDISLNANNSNKYCLSADRTCHDEYYLSKWISQRETQTRLSWWLSLLEGVARNIHSTTYYWCSLQNKVLRVNSALIPAFRSLRTSNWDLCNVITSRKKLFYCEFLVTSNCLFWDVHGEWQSCVCFVWYLGG